MRTAFCVAGERPQRIPCRNWPGVDAQGARKGSSEGACATQHEYSSGSAEFTSPVPWMARHLLAQFRVRPESGYFPASKRGFIVKLRPMLSFARSDASASVRISHDASKLRGI